jgi:hypothetical protein
MGAEVRIARLRDKAGNASSVMEGADMRMPSEVGTARESGLLTEILPES